MTKRKIVLLAGYALLSLVQIQTAHANMGGRVGNGGGLVVCRDSATQSIKSVELLDYYEARMFRGKTLDVQSLSGDWKTRLQQLINRFQTLSPMRVEIYSEWLKRFDSEAQFVTGVQFSLIPDTGFIAVPTGCEFEQGVFQSQPTFTGEKRYFVNNELWQNMDDSQKAGLIFHEFLYREAIGYGHSDSVNVRYLNGEIADQNFATLSEDAWITLLTQAKYEMTDKSYPASGATIHLDLSKIWLAAPGETVPDSILVDRFPVLLGTCSTDGCQTFAAPRDMSTRFSPYDLYLHPMVQEIDYGHQEFRNPNHRGYSLEDRITIVSFFNSKLTGFTWFTFSNNLLNKTFFLMQSQNGVAQYENGMVRSVGFSFNGGSSVGAIELFDLSTPRQSISSNSCDTYSASMFTGNAFGVIIRDNICEPPYGNTSVVVGNFPGGLVQISLKLIPDLARFDFTTGDYLIGGTLREIEFRAQGSVEQIEYDCGNFNDACMIKTSSPTSSAITSIQITQNVAFSTGRFGAGINLSLAPQAIQLYPSGYFKSAILAKDAHSIPKRDGTLVDFNAGDTINLDVDGFAL